MEILNGLIQFPLFLMGKFNSKVEQIESRTASWNGLCSTFEGPLYMNLERTRLRHRPRNRWQDETREDGRLVGGKGWKERVYISSVGATTLGGFWPALRFRSTIFYLYTSLSSFSLSSPLNPLLLDQVISLLVFLLVLMNMVPRKGI